MEKAPGSGDEEAARIGRAFARRLEAGLDRNYAWHRPEVRRQKAELENALARHLPRTVGEDLSGVRFLDVGCGSGWFLRLLLDWGAQPENLAGTEVLQERLDRARRLSAAGPLWHFGGLGDLPEVDPFDLVSAFTVFSSVLDADLRAKLAGEMWSRVAPGGAALVFDLRYDNPGNPDARRVTKAEIAAWWPEAEFWYSSLILAPPLARRVFPVAPSLARALGMLPPLRSHFLLVAEKRPLPGT